MPIDLNRTSTITLPADLAREVIQNATSASAVMSLAPQVSLPGRGLSIPVILGDPEADWAAETDAKAVSTPSVAVKTMTPYTLAVIVPMSKQFERDADVLQQEIVKRLPAALAQKFDSTVFFGTAPGSGFDTLAAAATRALGTDAWTALVGAKGAVATAGGDLNGWALSPAGETALLGAKDGNDRPLFLNGVTEGSIGRILAAPVVKSRAASNGTILGFGGDWSMARWGIVNGAIDVSRSDQATLGTGANAINLWQRNMVAYRAEVEIGFVCADDDYFCGITA